MVGSETMLKLLELSFPWEPAKLPFKEVTFFSRCKGPDLQDCLGQTRAMIRYDGLGDLGGWARLGGELRKGWLSAEKSGVLILDFHDTVQYHWTQGTRIQTSGLPKINLQ